MRLIDCHIENFGGLSEYSISFDKELTVLMESNGFGKSTLAAFIKAMFYGFPRGTKTLEKNERKLYTPWQGGKFGGNLSFEYEGISYRIERSFGATPKQDTFSLYELEPFKQSDRFSENIGVELFKLDVESYEKSTYMSQGGGIGSFATAGIQTKLGDLVEEADDIYNFDKALASLKDRRIKYKTYKGQSGSVYEVKNEISRLQTKLAEKAFVQENYNNLKEQYSELVLQEKEIGIELEAVRKRIAKASETAVLKNLSKQQAELKREKESVNIELEKILSVYKNGLPSKEATDAADMAAKNIGKIDSALNVLHISDEDKQIFEDKRKIFESGIPGESFFEGLQNQVKERNACLLKLSEKESKKETDSVATDKKVKVRLLTGVIIVSVLVIALLLVRAVIPAVALIAVALVMLITSKIVKPKSDAKPDDELISLRKHLGELDEHIMESIGKYYPDTMITPEEYEKYIFELKGLCRIYKNAIGNIRKYEKDRESYQQKRKAEQEIVENFANSHGFSKELLTDEFFRKIRADIINGENLSAELKKLEYRIKVFESENSARLDGFESGNNERLEVVRNEEATLISKEKELSRKLAEAAREIEQKERLLEQFPVIEDELAEWTAKYEEDIKACEILDQTIEYLTEAKDALNYNYIKPVKDRFDIYVDKIIGKDKMNMFMDKELQIKPEQYGATREMAYFSAGYTDIVRLCMHFALVDVLFEETDCFIILDDPFVNLDDEKTKEALGLLKELSSRRQLVYLTCNSSRI